MTDKPPGDADGSARRAAPAWPFTKTENFRKDFAAFGLAQDGRSTWDDLAPQLEQIGRFYYELVRLEGIEDVRIRLETLRNATRAAARAWTDLPKLLMDYSLGYLPIDPAYSPPWSGWKGPADQGEEVEALLTTVWGEAWAAYAKRYEAWQETNDAAGAGAMERMEAAHAELAAAQFTCEHPASSGQRETCPRCRAAEREAARASMQFALDAAPGQPEPYEIVAAEARRLGDLAKLIDLVSANFESDWPTRTNRSEIETASAQSRAPNSGRRKATTDQPARVYAVKAMVGLIDFFFEIDGLREILLAPNSFWSLLSAFESFAINENRTPDQWKSALNTVVRDEVVDRLRKRGVADADIPPKLAGRPPSRRSVSRKDRKTP